MEEEKGTLANRASPGYLIPTLGMRWGVLIEHFTWQVLLLKENKRKFLEGASWVCLAHTTGEHFFEKYFSIIITESSNLSSVQSTLCFTIMDIEEGCAEGSAKTPSFSGITTLFCRKLRIRMQHTDILLSSEKDLMSRTIYVFGITITTLRFLTPLSHKLLRFLCTHNMERKLHRS